MWLLLGWNKNLHNSSLWIGLISSGIHHHLRPARLALNILRWKQKSRIIIHFIHCELLYNSLLSFSCHIHKTNHCSICKRCNHSIKPFVFVVSYFFSWRARKRCRKERFKNDFLVNLPLNQKCGATPCLSVRDNTTACTAILTSTYIVLYLTCCNLIYSHIQTAGASARTRSSDPP